MANRGFLIRTRVGILLVTDSWGEFIPVRGLGCGRRIRAGKEGKVSGSGDQGHVVLGVLEDAPCAGLARLTWALDYLVGMRG